MADVCLDLWRHAQPRLPLSFPPHARVLEVGCAEADWMAMAIRQRPDLAIVGIDVRPCLRPAGTVIVGDVLVEDFPPESFDAAVGISSFEHIGLGHYGDPLDPDGDTHCLERIYRWLRPGGWVYGDVPFDWNRYTVLGSTCRIYHYAALLDRLLVEDFQLVWQQFFSHRGEMTMAPQPYRGGKDFGYIAFQIQKPA